jgi:hypothetical protein
MTCTVCGSQVIAASVVEALRWDKEHGAYCPGQGGAR